MINPSVCKWNGCAIVVTDRSGYCCEHEGKMLAMAGRVAELERERDEAQAQVARARDDYGHEGALVLQHEAVIERLRNHLARTRRSALLLGEDRREWRSIAAKWAATNEQLRHWNVRLREALDSARRYMDRCGHGCEWSNDETKAKP